MSDQDEPRFDTQNMSEQNAYDMFRSAMNDDIVALIDEEAGGIIAYVLRGHEDELLTLLNRQP